MDCISLKISITLQWVHGRMTVVMDSNNPRTIAFSVASMGPRSDDRGYARSARSARRRTWLQWVHGRMTVVMAVAGLRGNAHFPLQWVHGRMTVVMTAMAIPPTKVLLCFNGSTVG